MNKIVISALIYIFSVSALALDTYNFPIDGTWEVTKSYCMENTANVEIENIGYSHIEITDTSTTMKDSKNGAEEKLEVVSSVNSYNGDTFVLKTAKSGVSVILSSRMKMNDTTESQSPYFVKVEIRDNATCPGSLLGSTRIDILQKTQ